ncbi:DUF4031 domain-containing protein [Acinetobacter bouvetii]|uniref:DUF4031 domain-containing protein n=2 Tax=Acinetobacter TaxID=469 RepID=A0A4Q7AXQ1_9GAMM|nr:DUF4031 domain-containing protein [Acinetobacter bouvetii]RZG68420.1 DUF4031 domain-containing protein [Acinetobacter bouvetii]
MPIYVDNSNVPYKGKYWCHLMADNLEELHSFAANIGVKKCWFHRSASYPHYDITIEKRQLALILGASLADRKTIIACGKKLKIQLDMYKNKTYNRSQIELF